MIALVFDPAGNLRGAVQAPDRNKIKRALRPWAGEPGSRAVMVVSVRARTGAEYSVLPRRRQWFRGDNRPLTAEELLALRALGSEAAPWIHPAYGASS